MDHRSLGRVEVGETQGRSHRSKRLVVSRASRSLDIVRFLTSSSAAWSAADLCRGHIF